MPYTTCALNNANYGSSMVPGTNGTLQLLDGTVILASGRDHIMGDPIEKSLIVNGHTVKFDAVGLAAVRFNEKGEVEALVGGGLKLFLTENFRIKLSRRIDMALWRDLKGEWHGVLHGFDGTVPEELSRITSDWIKVNVPVVLKE
jgi:hypothetical protein